MQINCQLHNQSLVLFDKQKRQYFCNQCDIKSGDAFKSQDYQDNLKRLKNSIDLKILNDRQIIQQIENLLSKQILTNAEILEFENQFDMQSLNKKFNNLYFNTNAISLNDYQQSMENLLNQNNTLTQQNQSKDKKIQMLEYKQKDIETMLSKNKTSHEQQIQQSNQKSSILNTQITLYQAKIEDQKRQIKVLESQQKEKENQNKEEYEKAQQQSENLKQQLNQLSQIHHQQNQTKNENLSIISNQSNMLNNQIDQLNDIIQNYDAENKTYIEKIQLKKQKSKQQKLQIKELNQKLTKAMNQINYQNQSLMNFTSKVDVQKQEISLKQEKIQMLENQKKEIQSSLRLYQNTSQQHSYPEMQSIQSMLDQLENDNQDLQKGKKSSFQQQDISQKISFISSQINQFKQFQGSELMSLEQFQLIKQWSNIQNIKLIYKASLDGFDAVSFHLKCNHNGRTLILIRSEFNQTFGGYADCEWNQDKQWIQGNGNSFLFQLNKKTKHQCLNPEREMFGSPQYLIKFGEGADLVIQNNGDQNSTNYCRLGITYELPQEIKIDSDDAQKYLAGSKNFKIDDIEVYQVK